MNIAAAITISNLTTAVLEPALPIWMFYTMDAETWLQGNVLGSHLGEYVTPL